MGFDNEHPNRKDIRKPYYKSGKCARSCRPGGDCPYCQAGRQHPGKRREPADIKEQLEDNRA